MEFDGLRVIAVRILPGCASYIRKCLKDNATYYLCNDYQISFDGMYVSKTSKYIDPLDLSFFDTAEGNAPIINISAIVGKNGEGKSALVEIIIRLINNFSKEHNLDPFDSLLLIKGVAAELYFAYDGSLFCLASHKRDEEDRSTSLYRFVEDGERLKRADGEVEDEGLNTIPFYTLVSNYSLYAYNVNDFRGEWSKGDSEESKNCWLHHVFHKNDGYQVPLSLHPYRNWGGININTENYLSKQRLLTLFVHSYTKKADSGIHFHNINGKEAIALRLKDIGYSKLQRKTICKYFADHKNTVLLADYTDLFMYEKERTALTIGAIAGLRKVYDNYINATPELHEFVDNLAKWEWIQDCLPHQSDIKELLDVIEPSLEDSLGFSDAEMASAVIQNMRQYEMFNLCQLQRIKLMADVCHLWSKRGFHPLNGEILKIEKPLSCLLKKYEELTEKEKIAHYIIYKTISIFTTYPSYRKACMPYEDSAIFFGDSGLFLTDLKQELSYAFDNPITTLEEDWEHHSHIVLKLKQAYYYCYSDNPTSPIYTDENVHRKIDGDDMLMLKELSDRYKERLLYQENFPPPIFSWEIVFRRGDSNEYVTMDSFSSGEKQKLNNIGAILYHLLNINSVSGNLRKYHAVNIIFEEIEVYFHPEWQRTFVADLLRAIRQFDLNDIASINIILVTHSPYILSDIPKCNVLFLKEGRQVHHMQENTFGANIVSLLKNGFFLPSLPIGEFAYQKINRLFALLHSGDFDVDEIDNIKSEIMCIGEPAVRQQLLSLLNGYKTIGENPNLLKAVMSLMKQQNNDKS